MAIVLDSQIYAFFPGKATDVASLPNLNLSCHIISPLIGRARTIQITTIRAHSGLYTVCVLSLAKPAITVVIVAVLQVVYANGFNPIYS